ncbi:melanotransferrin-like [Montipora capricornis]|uniref:melanotransferrin-like n=1 Tax=Montipora capricornis TaxID=246305 RepID=UPI0035F18005
MRCRWLGHTPRCLLSLNMSSSYALLVVIVVLASGNGHIQMRWCVISEKEYTKCLDFRQTASTLSSELEFSCVNGSTPVDCMKKIKSDSADLITLDGGEIQTAGKDHGLVPVVGEDYYDLPGLDGVNYKAVAVVKKNNQDITFTTLKGKKSCHTGAGKTAGWNVPVGTLLRLEIMQQDESCNAYSSAGKFFEKSCVPNVKNKYPAAPDNLCSLCSDECKTTDGTYSGYSGAFKCMDNDLGDVAFIKHTTLSENNANASQYEYLCKNGSRKGSWENCYLADVPAHAVVTKSGHNSYSEFKRLLLKASVDYGVNQTNFNMFQLFNSSQYGGKDLLFKDSTMKLVDVRDRNSYEKWLGSEYLEDLKVLTSCPSTEGPSPPDEGPSASAPDEMKKPQLAVVMVSFIAIVTAVFAFE